MTFWGHDPATTIWAVRFNANIWKPALWVTGIVMLLLAASPTAGAQTTLYEENFNSYATGTTTSSKWEITTTGCNVGTSTDYFHVQSQKFEARDIDCEAVWMSSVIDLTNYTNISLSVYVAESGTQEGADYIKVYYKLNGGAETLFATNGSNVDDFTSKTATKTGLNGNTVQIVIRVKNDDGAEYHSFDNISVTGTYTPPAFTIDLTGTNVLCYGGSTGTVDLELPGGGGSGGSGSSAGCVTASATTNNCTGCTTTLSGSSNYTVSSGTVCIPAGQVFSGGLTIAGGTLVVCGTLQPSWISFYGGTLIINGTYVGSNLQINTTGAVQNYGTVQLSGWLEINNTFVNHGNLYVSSAITVNKLNGFKNYKNVFCSGAFNINQPGIENYSTMNVSGHLSVNSNGTFNNQCTVSIGGNLNVYDYTENHGNITLTGPSSVVNANDELVLGPNSKITTPNLTVNKNITHAGSGSCARISVANNTTINGSGHVSGSVDICDASGINNNWGTVTGGATTNCSCNATGVVPAVTCTYQWSNGATTQDITGVPAGNYRVTVTCGGTTATASTTLTQPTLLTVTGVVNMATPGTSDGSIDVTVTGGTSPYTYAWSNGATTQDLSSLAPGSFNVTVTDANGCTAFKAFVMSFDPVTSRCVCIGSGEWSTTAQWWGNCHGGNGQYPNELDTALISGYSVTVNSNAWAMRVELTAHTSATSLQMKNTATLDVVNDLNMLHTSGKSTVTLSGINNSITKVNGNINLTAAGANKLLLTFANNSTLKLKKGIIRHATNKYGKLTMSNEATIEFIGNEPQTIPANAGTGGDSFQYQNMKFTNTYGNYPQLSLQGNVDVTNKIIFDDGVVTTGSYRLTILNPAASSLTGYAEDSYVSGYLRRYIGTNTDTYFFPVGHPTDMTYDWFEVQTNNLIGVNYITANFGDITALDRMPSINLGLIRVDLTPIYSKGMWTVEPDRQPTGGYYTASASTEHFSGLKDNSFELLKRNVGGSPLDWSLGNGILPLVNTTGRRVADGHIKLSGLTSFSEFGIRKSEGGSSLPIELTSFSAKPENGKVRLDWSTAVEINNELFIVQRSEDAVNFTDIAEVPGAGNSNVQTDYVEYDLEPLKGTSFYRLKQVDYDGGFEYSDKLAVTITTIIKSDFQIVPNPNTGTFTLDITTTFEEAHIQVLNNFGQLVHIEDLTGIMGNAKRELDLRDELAAGVYFVKIDLGTNTFIKQMVIK